MATRLRKRPRNGAKLLCMCACIEWEGGKEGGGGEEGGGEGGGFTSEFFFQRGF